MRYPLFGPVLIYDLVRTARRGRSTVMRCVYLGVLLLAIFLLYEGHTHGGRGAALLGQEIALSPDDMARFADSFFTLYMVLQFLAVLLLTPVYTAGAIAEERERRTLEFLFATDLHSREIVFSKLVSRLLDMATLLMTGLPVLALLQLLGGVDPDLVLAGFLAVALLMTTLASVGVLISIYNRRTWDAMFRTYLATGLCFCGTLVIGSAAAYFHPALNFGNPAAALVHLERLAFRGGRAQGEVLWEIMAGYAAFHLLATSTCVTWAVLRLRPVALRVSQPEVATPTAAEKAEPAARWRPDRPPINDADPLLWKEVHEEPINWRRDKEGEQGCIVIGLVAGVLFLLYVVLAAYGGGRSERELIHGVVRVGSGIVAGFLLVLVGINAAGRFSREMERQTLDNLLTLPDRDRLLFSKWWASILFPRGFAWVLGWLLLVGLLSGGLHLLALPIFVGAWFVYAAFFAGLGLYFSLRTRSTVRATIFTLLTAGAIIAGSIVAADYADGIWEFTHSWRIALTSQDQVDYLQILEWRQETFLTRFSYAGTAPPVTLGFLAFSWEDVAKGRINNYVLPATIGVTWYAVLAGLLWTAAHRRFRRLIGEPTAERRLDPSDCASVPLHWNSRKEDQP